MLKYLYMKLFFKVKCCFFLFVASLLLTSSCFAFNASEVVNYQAPEGIFYRQTFDNLILDVRIPSGNEGTGDVLQAIIFKSQGTVFDGTDVTSFTLWADDNIEPGFQGMGVDKKIGTLIFNPNNYSWYLYGLSETVPADGLRVFVSVEVPSYATVNRFFKASLPAILDSYNNCQYDTGDMGVFLQSCNNGPTDTAVVNQYLQLINTWSVDSLAPKAVITLPENSQTITTSSYIIQGVVRDQGNSVINKVEVGIQKGTEILWHQATITTSVQQEKQWQYAWDSIAEGDYILKIKASDVNFGSAVSEREVAVNVVFAVAPETPETPEQPQAPEIPQVPDEPTSKAQQIEVLKLQIQQVQEQIIVLLSQLVQLLTAML